MSGGGEAKRWAKTLYNHPVCAAIDYFVVNLGDSLNRVDSESGGRSEYKLKAAVEENEEEIRNGSEFESITAEWTFSTLKARRYEPAGHPITRITGRLDDLNTVSWKELGLWVRTPEGVWGRLGRRRRELGSSGRELARREVFGYFTGGRI